MSTEDSSNGEENMRQEWNTSAVDPFLLHALTTAETAARTAGSYLQKMLGYAHIDRQKAPFDDLWDVDLQAEHIILDQLKRTFMTQSKVLEQISRLMPQGHPPAQGTGRPGEVGEGTIGPPA